MVVLVGEVVAYEQGTPVRGVLECLHLLLEMVSGDAK